MPYDPNIHHRSSIRLKGYNYSQAGAYFVTVCVQGRECLFGDVVDGRVRLNEWGEMVVRCWEDLQQHHEALELDEFVVMPNHLHGIVVLPEGEAFAVGPGATRCLPAANPSSLQQSLPPPHGTRPGSLGAIVQNFKAVSTRRFNQRRGTPGAGLWQRNYYDRIIRDEADLAMVREYVANNPLRWELDELHTLSR